MSFAQQHPDGTVLLPTRHWHGGGHTELTLPPDGSWELLPIRGARAPTLTPDQIAAAVSAPLGSPPLAELARGRERAVVLFDDLTRPTRAGLLAEPVLRELEAGGLHPDQISLVCATGAHAPLDGLGLRSKLGDAIVARYRVVSHHPWDHCPYVGTTRAGVPLHVNRGVVGADLKVALGSVMPHPNTGLSGGGKIVLPGVAGLASIAWFHTRMPRAGVGWGRTGGNPMAQAVEEAAALVGLDVTVNVVLNEAAEAAAVWAGAPAHVRRASVKHARRAYRLARPTAPPQVVVVNALAKPSELLVAWLIGRRILAGRGTVVVLADAPEGQVVHYMMSRLGEGYGGLRYPTASVGADVRLVVQLAQPDRSAGDWFADPEAITWTRTWEETQAVLKELHPAGAHTVVVPNGTMALV